MSNYFVHIISYENGEIGKEMGPYSERDAEKISGALDINLSLDYYTVVVEMADTTKNPARGGA